MSGAFSLSALQDRVSAFSGRKIVVAGDPVLDVYIYGTTLRISREAPVPIVREDAIEHRLGGAANAAANLAALGAEVSLLGVIGADDAGRTLRALCAERGVDASGLIASPLEQTVAKTRILAGGLHTRKQQLLRIDREASPVDREAERALEAAAARPADALVLSDYGVLSEVYQRITRALAGRLIVVDSRYALLGYHGARAVTPNEPEAEAALARTLGTARDAVHAAEAIRAKLDLDAALLTRGREGMAVARRGEPTVLLDAHGPKEAVDVTGAGDTVIATFTLARAAGAPTLDAAVLANCAASVVVQRTGAATCTQDDLQRALADLDPSSVREVA